MAVVPSYQQLADLEACRDAARRYSRGLDRLDANEMKSAYWPDGTDDHGVFVGNAMEFCDRCVETHGRWAFTMHIIMNHVVELDDDGVHARGECYNTTYLRSRDDDTLNVWFGRYLDTYEKRGDEWRIQHRICVHEGDVQLDASTPMPIPGDKFRQGDEDRETPGRPVGT